MSDEAARGDGTSVIEAAAGGAESGAPNTPPTGYLGLVTVFTLTTFLSAALLFAIQPLFAKLVLPVLGGSPSVWAVAMCFFQAALLVGYLHAHLLGRYVSPTRSGLVHLGLCAAAVLVLPISIPESWREPPPGEPALWQLGLFSVAVGLPFVAVAANAPLLQAWFAKTGHRNAGDPYFLYAASNLGSMLALLGYPLVLEPALGASAVSRLWTAGFIVLALAIGLCFWLSRLEGRAPPTAATDEAPVASNATAPGWLDRARWVGLALVPSALLTAFTTHIATDIASAPLLWVVPLALYLLTFVIVFRDRAWVPPRLLLIVHLAAVIAVLLQLAQSRREGWFISSTVGVAAFVTSALVAHRTLYESRPDARHLTEFYLWMSFGGALGGLFAALIAPRIFPEVFEYPLLMALTMACRPRALEIDFRDRDEFLRLWMLIAGAVLAIFWVPWGIAKLNAYVTEGGTVPAVVGPIRDFINRWGAAAMLAGGFAIAMVLAIRHPARQLAMALMMFFAVVTLDSGVKRGAAQRSYFGVYRVMTSSDNEYQILTHGTTLHGAQRVREADGTLVVDTTPATYYHPKSPMAVGIEIVRAATEAAGRKVHIGVIGLGTGSLACYIKPEERWRFFEIDPVVVAIARNPEAFSFLHYCQPEPDIVLGDARLTMSKEPDGSYDLIIVDAFSSDAVPVHLMTAEALRMYATKLAPEGVMLLHISNRYLDLDRVLGATAPLVPGLHGLIVSDDESDGSYASSTSTVAVFSASAEAIDPFRGVATAQELDGAGMRGWTDDHSDVLRPFLSKMRK
jgi:spermidine synthase